MTKIELNKKIFNKQVIWEETQRKYKIEDILGLPSTKPLSSGYINIPYKIIVDKTILYDKDGVHETLTRVGKLKELLNIKQNGKII